MPSPPPAQPIQILLSSAQFTCHLIQAAFPDWAQMMYSFSRKHRVLFCNLHLMHLCLFPFLQVPPLSISIKAVTPLGSRPALQATHKPWTGPFTSLSGIILICKIGRPEFLLGESLGST